MSETLKNCGKKLGRAGGWNVGYAARGGFFGQNPEPGEGKCEGTARSGAKCRAGLRVGMKSASPVRNEQKRMAVHFRYVKLAEVNLGSLPQWLKQQKRNREQGASA